MEPTHAKIRSILLLFLILEITFLAFRPCLYADFLNWDDPGHLLENKNVRALDAAHLQTMFTTSVIKTYIPFTMLSYAAEHYFFGYAPFVYHLDNLLLHLGIVALIYFLFFCLGMNLRVAGFSALLFAIHPMHVESVAWVAERKDLLYSLFYVWALLSYVKYLQNQNRINYLLSILFGLASMLSKPMALSLPLAFLILDWFLRRGKIIFRDKILHFLYVIPIASITSMQHARIPFENAGQAVLIWIWTAGFYVRKFILPESLVPYYLLPQPVALGYWQYLSAVLFFLAILFLSWRFRRYPVFIFAIIFYACSTFFLWRYDNFGESIVADHYMYLPSLGFCLLFGIFCDRILSASARGRTIVKWGACLGIAVVILGLGVKTYFQCFIWQNSYNLWTHVIRYYPETATAYNNRGTVQKTYGAAIADYSRALAIDPKFWEAYFNRGRAYYNLKEYDLALRDLDQLLAAEPGDAVAYYSRGKVFQAKRLYDAALADFSKALELVPGACSVYRQRALLYELMGNPAAALQDQLKLKTSGCSGE